MSYIFKFFNYLIGQDKCIDLSNFSGIASLYEIDL